MIINNAAIILPDREITSGAIFLNGDIIQEISEKPLTDSSEYFDASGLIAVPGLIDLHIHGAFGYSVQDKDPESLINLAKNLPRFGITGFLWTTMAMPEEDMDRVMKTVAIFKNENSAECLGVNIEGSFISSKRRGSHDPKYIYDPDISLMQKWQKLSNNQIRVVTIAPEKSPPGFIEYLVENNIIPSIGHSFASYDQTKEALARGASFFTHLGNATGMIHQREPGLVGAALLDDNSSIEIICDGVHLHSAIVQIFIKVKGWDKIVIVSDGTCVLGMEPGKYQWYDQTAEFDGNSLKLIDGTIAGGALPLNKALKNLINFTGCSLSSAVRMTSLRPARVIGMEHLYGSLTPGKKANLVLLDSEFEVHYTFVDGKIVFRAD